MEKIKVPKFWGIHAQPGLIFSRILGIAPIVLLVCVYLTVSHTRQKENKQDKLMPTVSQMYQEMKQISTVPDKRTDTILFWSDTKASLCRLGIGVGISAILGYGLGIILGIFPSAKAIFVPIITVLSNINPLAVLVIVLVALGIGEGSKIFLIVFGVGIPLVRSIQQSVENVPKELITKVLTLGGSQFEVITRVIAPQVLPQLIELVRVSLGQVWIFVIAAEAVASTEGLGYRIYLQQRYMNMALIIPYVLYISLLAYVMDAGLLLLQKKCFPWYKTDK
ncbi:MAG: ABC transporter permease [Candidatus Paceibacterota bacterium]|jgi:NitT/TauT family transport system permease protein